MKAALLALCLACACSGILVGQQSNRQRIVEPPASPKSGTVKPPKPYGGQQRFEYLVRYIITDYAAQSELNKLGLEGWELVAALPPDGNAKANLCYFKRPVASVAAKEDSAEQGGAGQPATRPVAEPEGGDKPQPDAEGRSR